MDLSPLEGGCPANLLDLGDLIPTAIRHYGSRVKIDARGVARRGEPTRLTLIDTPFYAKPTKIAVRLVAPVSGHPAAPARGTSLWVPGWGFTRRAVEAFACWLLGFTTPQARTHFGADAALAAKVVRLLVKELEATRPHWTARVVGMDDLHLLGTTFTLVVDLTVTPRRVIALLWEASKKVVSAWLAAHPEVEVVVSDNAGDFAAAIIAAKRVHVRDKKHNLDIVLRPLLAERTRIKAKIPAHVAQIDGGRKKETLRYLLARRWKRLGPAQRSALEATFAALRAADGAPSDLEAAYRAKERFNDIYLCQSRAKAKAALKKWERSLTPVLKAIFNPVLVTLCGPYREGFLTYFDERVTNGATEALVRRAKEIAAEFRGNVLFPVWGERLFYRCGKRTQSEVARAVASLIATYPCLDAVQAPALREVRPKAKAKRKAKRKAKAQSTTAKPRTAAQRTVPPGAPVPSSSRSRRRAAA